VESSCVSGSIVITGIGRLIDNSGPNCTVVDSTLTETGTADAVWDELTTSHEVSGSFGEKVSDIKIDTSLIPATV